jgi:hypothetical protein
MGLDRLYKLFQAYLAEILWQAKNIPSDFAAARWNRPFSHAANRPGTNRGFLQKKSGGFFAIGFLHFSPPRSEPGKSPNES